LDIQVSYFLIRLVKIARISDFEFRISDFEFRISDFGFRISDFPEDIPVMLTAKIVYA